MAEPQHVTVRAARSFAGLTPEQVYAHWTSKEARLRWEAGPDTGMTYDAFDTREGGCEIVRVTHDGAEIGHMEQRYLALAPNCYMVMSVRGIFGGTVTLVMQILVRFVTEPGGAHIEAVADIVDLAGNDPTDEHQKGWAWLLGRFAEDIAAHGPATAREETP